MKAIFALYRAQAREFIRDRNAVLFILLFPVVFAVFFGLIFSGGSDFVLQLGVVNEDGPEAERLLSGLPLPTSGESTEQAVDPEETGMVVQMGTREELLGALKKGELHVVLVLPAGIMETLGAGEPVDIQVYYDPSRNFSSGVGLGIVRRFLDDMNLSMSGTNRLLRVQEETVQVEAVRQIDFFIPGMLGVAMLWLGIFGVAQPVVAQREAKILRRLSVTAIGKLTMLVAEVSWRISLGIIQTGVFLLVGYLLFDIKLQNILPFAGGVLLGTLVFVCLGYVLVGMSKTSESAMAVSQLVNLPMMMLSGSIMDVEMLPKFFKPIVDFLPLTYLSDLFRQTMTGLTPLHPLWLDFAVLGGWFTVLFILSAVLWRWE